MKKVSVIALGYRAALIVDRLRFRKQYEGIRFVYCNADRDLLKDCGNEDDEHILLTDVAQCIEDIHEEKVLMSVLVSCLGNDLYYKNFSWKYASVIMEELWKHSDHTYCFASLPFWAGGQRDLGIEEFKKLTYWSDITVLQDDLKEPNRYWGYGMDEGLVDLLDLILRPIHGDLSQGCDKVPFGVWATQKQLITAFMAKYSNNMPEYYKEGTFSFHKSTHED